LPCTERDVTVLLDFEGQRLHLYFRLMLGDGMSAARALSDTIIAALPDTSYRPDASYRRLFTIARTVCRQYRSIPAASAARARVPSLAAVTTAALLRLDPDDREVCVLGAPRYRLADPDLAAVLGTRMVADLRRQALARFERELEACAADAGLGENEDLPERALRTLGSEPAALPYDQIIPLATDPVLERLREDIRARVARPAETTPAAGMPLEALGTGPRMAISTGPLVSGLSRPGATRPHLVIRPTEIRQEERSTAPLHRVPAKGDRPSAGRRRAVVGAVLVAGVTPVAIIGMALAGHPVHQDRDSAASPPSPPSAAGVVPSPVGVRHTPQSGRSPVQGAPASTAGAVPSARPTAPGASMPAMLPATTAPPPATLSPEPAPTTSPPPTIPVPPPLPTPTPSPTRTKHGKGPKSSPPS
jgi:hypothetical protein